MKYLVGICLTLLIACNGGGPEPPVTTTVPPDPTTSVPVDPPPTTVPPVSTTTTDPEPEPPRASEYIQWSCDDSKPNCRDRFSWSRDLDLAYHVYRGHRDLEALYGAPEFLVGGSKETVPLTQEQLAVIITDMSAVDEKGNRLIWRIENEMHRDFDTDPLGDWHRSQVRKDIAREMLGSLNAQTETYSSIASEFPLVPGCDSIACKVKEL